MDEKVNEWILRDCTRPSASKFRAPALLVPKKQYKGILANDRRRAYLEDSLDCIRGDTFSDIDLKDGYYQQMIHEKDIHKTRYTTPSSGHYEMLRVLWFDQCRGKIPKIFRGLDLMKKEPKDQFLTGC
eukprot:TRINITY_DN976_c0_g1_i10.p2 TRINITY_DN976_c0_g1~~TRINITY_DN976_c0_g1_i10.p2  ORF type:complete len:128 (-),score=7.14 TRINITY_DN976_c0_g1_i10:1056-1439(-)